MRIEKFKQAAAAEWVRLNPRYVHASDGLPMVFLHACKETVPGFFAPLFMLFWLMRYATAATILALRKAV